MTTLNNETTRLPAFGYSALFSKTINQTNFTYISFIYIKKKARLNSKTYNLYQDSNIESFFFFIIISLKDNSQLFT